MNMNLMTAYEKIHFGFITTKAQKMAICEELNLVPTNRIKEIEKQILELMRKARNAKDSYSKEDIENFCQCYDCHIYCKKTAEIFELEKPQFIKSMADYIDNQFNIKQLMQSTNRSYVDNYQIDLYRTCIFYLIDNGYINS